MGLREEFLKYKHSEYIKQAPINRVQYEKLLRFAVSINTQLLETKKDVKGNDLTAEQLKIVKHTLNLARTEQKLLEQD
ncbi:hypothetical protein PDQ75_24950 [Bacillus cereus group sp. Bc015]|uniref:hypothetical protein n=1 Tax=Bacillus cereus group sp. Bc015 TaxID=3018123 RepID=UPI0022DF2ECE|nr:hypothetical protein [Bacillus cereus group sp. Bc015]MDA2738405.1 hypothetical protein [Bacillus cereus group sp. Bc015]